MLKESDGPFSSHQERGLKAGEPEAKSKCGVPQTLVGIGPLRELSLREVTSTKPMSGARSVPAILFSIFGLTAIQSKPAAPIFTLATAMALRYGVYPTQWKKTGKHPKKSPSTQRNNNDVKIPKKMICPEKSGAFTAHHQSSKSTISHYFQ